MTTNPNALIHPSRIPNRWVQLMAGIVAMMAIANLQYAWTLFTKPIQAHLHVSLVAVQWTFTLFVALETWLVPFEGYLVDRIGPRLMLGLGSIMVGLGWIGSGRAETINSLYFWYGLGGIGAGIVYGGAIGNALKWFPDHRGLCVGLTAGAFGIGTATTIAPIADMLKDHELPAHFHRLGNYSGSCGAGFLFVPGKTSGGMDAAELERERSENQSQSKYVGGRHDPVGDAKTAIVLRHLRNDDHARIWWPGGNGTTESHGFFVPCRQNCRSFWHDRVGAGNYRRPDSQRIDSSVLGMGIR